MVSICRLCASFKPLNELNTINEQFAKNIEYFCRIKISLTEISSKPKHACIDCTELMTKFCEFSEKSTRAQHLLDQFFLENTTKKETMKRKSGSMILTKLPKLPKNEHMQITVDKILNNTAKNGNNPIPISDEGSSDSDSSKSDKQEYNLNTSKAIMTIKSTTTWDSVPVTCLRCDKRIVGVSNLKLHNCTENRRSDDKIIECGYCGKSFKAFGYFIMHVNYHVPQLKDRYVFPFIIYSSIFNIH